MNLHRIDDYWSNFFGIESTEFLQSGVIVVPHDYLEGYKGAWLFQHQQKTIISVESKIVEQTRSRIKTLNSEHKDLFSKAFIDHVFGNRVEMIIGPAYQGYFDNREISIPTSKNVVKISYEKHQELIEELSESSDEEGWSHSGVDKTNDEIYGYFHNGDLVSIGCYTILRGNVGFVGVYTDPKFRGKGFSQEVLKVIVNELSSKGFLIRYQTLISNKPSIAIASNIGFRAYATHVAIRLKKED